MKKFKIIDFWISTFLIITFFILILCDPDFLFAGYFTVGAWQVISMIVHAVTHCFTAKTGNRYIYHWITFVSLATFYLGSFYLLLFAAPFMAIAYTIMCYEETFKKMKRPLADLK